MAKTSKQKQAIRRAKRRATTAERCVRFLTETAPQLEQQLQQMTKENYMVKGLLFALLAQQGGRMEVTKGTFEQTVHAFPRLSVSNSVKDGDEQTHVLTLVEAPEETSAQTISEPALTITKMEDPEYVSEFAREGWANQKTTLPERTEPGEPTVIIRRIADDPAVEEPFPGSTEQPMSGSV